MIPAIAAMKPADTMNAARSRPSLDSDTSATVRNAKSPVPKDDGNEGGYQFRG